VTTANLAPLGDQDALQHSLAGERKLQMQLVETSHHQAIGISYEFIHAATCRYHIPYVVADVVGQVEGRLEAVSAPFQMHVPLCKTFNRTN